MKKKVVLVCLIITLVSIYTFAAVEIFETLKFNSLSKFDQMVAAMNDSIEDDLEFNTALKNYKYLEYGYKVKSESMEFLADLIIDGYSATDVIRSAYFWLDTGEDVSIVKKMCDWREKNSDYKERYWTEEAFNVVTNNKIGVLTPEDMDAYREKGIDIEAIAIANRLSRMGVYTIYEILEKYENGKLMTDIALEIESQKSWTEHLDIISIFAAKTVQLPKAADVEIFDSRQLAVLKNAPEQAFYDSTDETTNIADELKTAQRSVKAAIADELEADNYLRNYGEEVADNEEY